MLVGILVIGMAAGLVAAGVALLFSLPLWVALLAYALGGSVAVAVTAIVLALRRRSRPGRDPAAAVSASSGK
ncbi:MAG: hypothetical protein RIT14_902 [Pseudomonadota bacterium]|jgi:membrane protein implicated in regulation of membrane protease activity